ncbi:cyclopentanol dehydrogenase [bacterium BMS3Abin05]|nr:cyclopentanol dehydrogenase [bacterium BMS3Abin05]GBE28605.1 cyclopentanol dehydrogenase [bacterium BMS3Bbin03]HDZ11273.1 glucose 1-dehydrogenase [Bacteroidota bacterium]
MKLENKIAIITGMASGIGRAAAFLFAEEGARVLAVDIQKEAGEEVVTAIREKGFTAEFFHRNLTDLRQIREMVDKSIQMFGRLDILYNNAGVDFPGTVLEVTEEDWEKAININLKSVFFSCKYAVEQMIRQKTGGVIVNTGSVASVVATPQRAVYDTAKGGVLQLTKSIALDFAEAGIRANCLIPGIIATAMTNVEGSVSAPPALEGTYQPLGRMGTPEEVAKAALFLASDDSSFITGTALVVDGGYLLH